MRYCIEKYAKPTYFIDALTYSFPIHMVTKLGIRLVVYGENINYEYGGLQK